ncbi:MAG: hypothetical protein ACON5B_12385, partial [Myxococcota bacterium]
MRSSPLGMTALLTLALACNNADQSDSTSPTDTDVGDTTDTEPVDLGEDPMVDLNVPAAFDYYQARLDADPSDAEAHFGRALTDLLLINRWGPVQDMATWCDEDLDVEETLWSPIDGLISTLPDAYEVTATTTMTADGVGYDFFDAPKGRSRPMDTPGAISLDLASGYYANSILEFHLNLGDAYWDNSNVEITPDTVLTIDDETGDQVVFLSVGCDDASDICNRYYVPTSGSVTVHSIGQEPGDLVDVSYDLTFNGESNGWDTGGARQDGSVSISISGTLSDTISTRIEDVDFPLKDKEALCDLVNCATSGPLLMVGIDEYCEDIPSLDAVHVMGAQMASRLRAVAGHFRAAGEGSLAYVLPTESLYLTDADVLFGEADALALAASIEAAAFVFEFMDQYDILDSDKAFDDYTTSNDWYRWDGNSCEVVPGVIDDRRALHDDLGAYAASPRTGFSLSEAQASLDHVFTDLLELLAASPTHGVLRPQGGANRDVREAYAGDLTALRTSLATPGATAIPSTSGFINATLNDFFTTPPTRDAILKSYTNGNPVIAS